MRLRTQKKVGLKVISTSLAQMEQHLLKRRITTRHIATNSILKRTVFPPPTTSSSCTKLLYTTSAKLCWLSYSVARNSKRLIFSLETMRRKPLYSPKLSCGLMWSAETRQHPKPLSKPNLCTPSHQRIQLLWLLNRLNKPLSICDRLRRKLKTLRAKRMPWNYRYAT